MGDTLEEHAARSLPDEQPLCWARRFSSGQEWPVLLGHVGHRPVFMTAGWSCELVSFLMLCEMASPSERRTRAGRGCVEPAVWNRQWPRRSSRAVLPRAGGRRGRRARCTVAPPQCARAGARATVCLGCSRAGRPRAQAHAARHMQSAIGSRAQRYRQSGTGSRAHATAHGEPQPRDEPRACHQRRRPRAVREHHTHGHGQGSGAGRGAAARSVYIHFPSKTLILL